MESLPEIVKREVLFPKLNDKQGSVEERKQTTNRIISMLAVNFVDDEDRKLAIAEFRTFLREFSLTGEEIIEGYRMALKKELQNGRGETINVYPNLSLIQAGEIINAYKEYKILNHQHSKGIALLRQLTITPENKPTPEEIHENFLQSLYEELKAVKYSVDAWLLFDQLEKSAKLPISVPVKKRLYQREVKKHAVLFRKDIESRKRDALHAQQLIRELNEQINSGNPIGSVVNRCRTIVVCNFLKKHLANYETFKMAINE